MKVKVGHVVGYTQSSKRLWPFSQSMPDQHEVSLPSLSISVYMIRTYSYREATRSITEQIHRTTLDDIL